MSSRGFALGADSLIELLRSGSEIPKEELIWALECISGLSLGEDTHGWGGWWESVPDEAKR